MTLSVSSDQCPADNLNKRKEDLLKTSVHTPMKITSGFISNSNNEKSVCNQSQACSNENKGKQITDPKIKIDVSEVKDGISSVQITMHGGNGNKPSKSDLKKMKELLLTSLEAS